MRALHVFVEVERDMEIRTLRNFIAVVQEEGVTAAADVLRVSQPALSRQIKGLESGNGGDAVHTRYPRSASGTDA